MAHKQKVTKAVIAAAGFGTRFLPQTKAMPKEMLPIIDKPVIQYIVEQLVEDLRSGRKDHEDFWIEMGGKYVLIRYFAVRSRTGEYLGALEVTQDIAPIQALEGEKRLLD